MLIEAILADIGDTDRWASGRTSELSALLAPRLGIPAPVLEVAREAIKECPKVELCIVVDGEGESDRIVGLQQATSGMPKTPIASTAKSTPSRSSRPRR